VFVNPHPLGVGRFVEMSVLSDVAILQAIGTEALQIAPFSRRGLQPATYDMRLYWRVLVSPTRLEQGRFVDLRVEPNRKFAIVPGRFVAALTFERLAMPLHISGRFGLKSKFTRRGLIAFPGIQIDPGFRGRLAISLFNAGPEPIELKYLAPMFSVEFHTLEAPAQRGYSGVYQGQKTFPPDQEKFILNAKTVSLAEIGELPDEVADLRRKLVQHEAERHVGGAALTVADLARIQGVVPLANLDKLGGVWPSKEAIDDFLATVKRWRSEPSP
jgi:dCTP deaminase